MGGKSSNRRRSLASSPLASRPLDRHCRTGDRAARPVLRYGSMLPANSIYHRAA